MDFEDLDEIRAIIKSRNRFDIVTSLSDADMTQKELRSRLDIPRTSMRRNLEELEQMGIIELQSGSYSLTLAGRIIMDRCSEMGKTLTHLEDLKPLLQYIPPEFDALDLDALEGSEILLADEGNPYAADHAAMKEHVAHKKVRMLVPIITPIFVNNFKQHILEHGTEVDMVVSENAMDALRSDYAEDLEDMLDTGLLKIHVHKNSLPFTLAVRENQLTLFLFDDGVHRACLKNRSSEAIEWENTCSRDT